MIILIGKTASGKDSVAHFLVNNCGFNRIITYTTRPKRPYEKDGIQYHFITKENFLDKVAHGFFLEHKEYETSFGTWYYGSAKEDYENAAKNTLIILTPSGYLDFLSLCKATPHTSIYLNVSEETIRKRLTHRGDDNEEIERRIKSDNSDFAYVESMVDYVVCNENKSIENVAKEIVKLYEER